MFNVLDHGLFNDNTTDNRQALVTLIATVQAAGGGTIYFPAGKYRFSSWSAMGGDNTTIVLHNQIRNIRFLGDGPASQLYWDGVLASGSSRHFILIDWGCQNITFEQLAFHEGTGAKSDEHNHAIGLTNRTLNDLTITRNIENVLVTNCYFSRFRGDAINCGGGIAPGACASFAANAAVGHVSTTYTQPAAPQRVALTLPVGWNGGGVFVRGTVDPTRGRRQAANVNVIGFAERHHSQNFEVGMEVIATLNPDGTSPRLGSTTISSVFRKNVVITSVDATTDTITTSGAHGLTTDQGPFRIVVEPTGTIPGGLSASTDYYALFVSSNQLQLRTAPMGATVNITSSGATPLAIGGTITLASAAAISGFANNDYLFELRSENLGADPGTTQLTAAEYRTVYDATKSAVGSAGLIAKLGYVFLVRGVRIHGNTFNGLDFTGHGGNLENSSGYRSAIGAQSLTADIEIRSNVMTGCGDQLIDFEPTGNGDMLHWVIEDNVILNASAREGGSPPENAVTLFGNDQAFANNNKRSRFCRNRVYGRVFGGKMTGCDISDNVITTVPGFASGAINLTGRCDDLVLERNQVMLQPTSTGDAISFSTVTVGGVAYGATGVVIRDNVVQYSGMTGISLDGVMNATIGGNRVISLAPSTNGIRLQAINSGTGRPVGRIVIEGNIFDSLANGNVDTAIRVLPASQTNLGITVIGNRGTPLTYGVRFEPGTFTRPPIVIGNDFGGTTPISLPSDFVVVIGGNVGDWQLFRSTATDPNTIPALNTAPLSSQYTAGNAAATVWRKATAGASGWVNP